MCNDLGHHHHETPAGSAGGGTSRRNLLHGALAAGGLGLAGVLAQALPAAAAPAASADGAPAVTGDRIVALGLDGGPKLNNVPPPIASAKPSLALVVNGATYLVDAGFDTARQLLRAGLTFASVRDTFVTHHHFDHTSGLPGLVLHGWTANTPLSRVTFWGPPSMADQLSGVRKAFAEEVRLFEVGGGFPPFPQLRAREVVIPSHRRVVRVMEDENVVVDATHVFHGPEVKNAYAYRFTVKSTGKVVVFSGDTAAPNANLIALAHGCDVLVHEVQDNDNVEKIVASIPDPTQAAALRTHLLQAHSNVYDVPKVAKAAEAATLVLSHYTPLPQPPAVYLGKAQSVATTIAYTGRIIAPLELDAIAL